MAWRLSAPDSIVRCGAVDSSRGRCLAGRALDRAGPRARASFANAGLSAVHARGLRVALADAEGRDVLGTLPTDACPYQKLDRRGKWVRSRAMSMAGRRLVVRAARGCWPSLTPVNLGGNRMRTPPRGGTSSAALRVTIRRRAVRSDGANRRIETPPIVVPIKVSSAVPIKAEPLEALLDSTPRHPRLGRQPIDGTPPPRLRARTRSRFERTTSHVYSSNTLISA